MTKEVKSVKKEKKFANHATNVQKMVKRGKSGFNEEQIWQKKGQKL